MTWEIALGIFALVTFVGSVSVWIFKLSRTLAILEITIKTLNVTLTDFKTNNKESHKELNHKYDAHEERLNDHERRISHLEK